MSEEKTMNRRQVLQTIGAAGVALTAGSLLSNGSFNMANGMTVTGSVYGTYGTDPWKCVIATTIADIRACIDPDPDRIYFVSDPGYEGHFWCDPSDLVSLDNTGAVLKAASGEAFKRIFVDKVSVRWFGATGSGIADDSAAIQAAVDCAAILKLPVYFPRPMKYYLIGQTVLLPSQTTLIGDRSELKSIPVNNGPNHAGFIPTTIIKNADTVNGNHSITIRGLVFNGAYLQDGALYDPANFDLSIIRVPKDIPTEIANTLRFTRVEGFVMEDVTVYNCASNWGLDLERDFSSVSFDECRYMTFNTVLYKDSRIEGFHFYDCHHIKCNNFRTYNKINHSWTAFHMWYCTDVAVDNSTFEEDINNSLPGKPDDRPWSGSTVNLCLRNAKFTNCTFIGGKGIGLENEANQIAFQEADIVFENCYIEVAEFGIYRPHYSQSSILKNLTVKNCTIKASNRGIRADDIDGLEFENNSVTTTANFSACVALGNIARNCRIRSNTVKSHALLWGSLTGGISSGEDVVFARLENITVEGNDFEALPLGGQSSGNGQSCFVYFRNHTSTSYQSTIQNLWIKNNNVRLVEGGFITLTLDAPNFVSLHNVIAEGNYVSGTAAKNTERPFSLQQASRVTIRNNRCFNIAAANLINCSNILIEENWIDWDTGLVLAASPYLFQKCTGDIILRSNYAPRLSPTYGHFREAATPNENTFAFAVMKANEPNTGTNLVSGWNFGRSKSFVKFSNTTGINPSIRNFDGIIFNPTSAIDITQVSDGEANQLITLYFENGNTTIKHNTWIRLTGGLDYTGTAGSVLTLTKVNSSTAAWLEVSRSV